MAPEKFDALVAENVAAARRDPARFRARLIRFALLGYGYVALLIFVATVGMGVAGLLFRRPGTLALGVALLVAFAVLLQSILRALRVGTMRPHGVALSARAAPRLFEEIARHRTRLGGPRLRRLVVTGDFNAAVAEVPRLGFFWWRDQLVIGLPLLMLCAPDEFRAILAHELGHVAHRHGRTTAWLYRTHVRWARLDAELDHIGRVNRPLKRFAKWFAPRFNAAALVVCRAQESDADQASVEAGGCNAAASALVRTAILGRHLDERFWPSVWKRLQYESEPPRGIFRELASAARTLDPTDSSRWLAEALAVPTNNTDTHPCLAERLRAIGTDPTRPLELPGPPEVSAFEAFCGDADTDLVERIDAKWRDLVAASWRIRHESLCAALQKPAESDEGERWSRICRLIEAGQGDAVLPEVEAFAAEHPDHAPAQYTFGDMLLDHDDERGIAALERAMAADRRLVPHACERIRDHLQRKGRAGEAKSYERKAYEHEALLEEAHTERWSIDHRTPLVPHGLDPSVVERMVAVLREHIEIRYVDAARVELKHLTELPVVLLAITRDVRWYRALDVDPTLVGVLDELVPSGIDLYVFAVRSDRRRIAKRVARQPGARIYDKNSPPP